MTTDKPIRIVQPHGQPLKPSRQLVASVAVAGDVTGIGCTLTLADGTSCTGKMIRTVKLPVRTVVVFLFTLDAPLSAGEYSLKATGMQAGSSIEDQRKFKVRDQSAATPAVEEVYAIGFDYPSCPVSFTVEEAEILIVYGTVHDPACLFSDVLFNGASWVDFRYPDPPTGTFWLAQLKPIPTSGILRVVDSNGHSQDCQLTVN